MWRVLTTVDLTRLRRRSAVRRGLLVVLTVVVGVALTDPETAALASVASLFVGLQDRAGGTVPHTARVMVVESVLLSGVVLAGGMLSSVRPAAWALLVLAAAGAGLTAAHDKAVSRMLGDVLPLAAFLGLTRETPQQAAVQAALVLGAGLAQAISARLWVRVEGDISERRPVAAAMVAVADHLDDALPRRSTLTGRAAEDRLAEASRVLSRSDLTIERLRALRKLLADCEVLREEAAAIRLRKAKNIDVIRDREVLDGLYVASRGLRITAEALTCQGIPGRFDARQEAILAQMYEIRLAATAIAEDTQARGTARALARQTLRVYQHVYSLMSAQGGRLKEARPAVAEGLWTYVRHPTRRDVISAVRLGLATVLSLLVADLLDIPHGSWVAATTVALLRPDYRALTSDTVARAVGTAVGAVAVVPMVALCQGIGWLELMVLGVLATAAFAITTVNEGLFVVVMTVQTVFTRAIVGEDPTRAAVLRVQDVLLGCVLAVILLYAMPISHGRKLSRDIVKYTAATADWVEAVRGRAAGEQVPGLKALREKMRLARVEVQHDLELRVLEPIGPGLSAWQGLVVFSRVHDCARAIAAAERSLKHGDQTGPESAVLAADIIVTLRTVVEALSTQKLPGTLVPPPDMELRDPIAELVAFANGEAHAALDAITVAPDDRAITGGWQP